MICRRNDMATILRSGDVYIQNRKGGKILETDEGYQFQYLPEYLNNHPVPASLTLPLQSGPYQSQTLFPFFDGLIPEGWLLDIAMKNWKLNHEDRFGLLLTVCKDSIGDVRIERSSV